MRDAAGKRFNPHVTIGVATEKYLNEMLAEPFPSFKLPPAGASVYQLGSFGTARKELAGADAVALEVDSGSKVRPLPRPLTANVYERSL